MARFSALITGILMLTLAGLIGLFLYLQYELTTLEAIAISTLVMLGLVIAHGHFIRIRDREKIEERLQELMALRASQERELEDFRKELAIQHQTLPEHIRYHMDPLTTEVEVMGTLIKQLAETTADMDARLRTVEDWKTRQDRQPSPPSPATTAPAPRVPAAASTHQTDTSDDLFDNGKKATVVPPLDTTQADASSGLASTVRRSIADNRIDLHLQPIVTLPQRQVFAYEALTRVRDENDAVLMPGDYMAAAEGAGVMPMIDNMLLLRSVQILRRLTQRKREVSIFCNISAASLVNGEFFGNFLNFMEANRELADYMVFEFSHATVRDMGPLEYETLSALTDIGFRLSMDQVEDLRFDFRELNRRGFRYVKVPAKHLISGWPESGSDIHAADLSRLLGRYGMELIADKIENEATVVDVLDCDAHYGQGYLFAPPRPVRAEALQPERQQRRPAAE